MAEARHNPTVLAAGRLDELVGEPEPGQRTLVTPDEANDGCIGLRAGMIASAAATTPRTARLRRATR